MPVSLRHSLLATAVLLCVASPAIAQTCSAFRSCDEAVRSFQSGNTGLDGDNDGIPCENLCSAAVSTGVAAPSGGAECRLNSAQIYAVAEGRRVSVRKGNCFMDFHHP